jgi:transposase
VSAIATGLHKECSLARKPFKVVAVALANKMARIAWALLAKGGTYRAPALAAVA